MRWGWIVCLLILANAVATTGAAGEPPSEKDHESSSEKPYFDPDNFAEAMASVEGRQGTTNPVGTAAVSLTSSGTGTVLFRVLFSLILIVGLIYGTTHLVRRLGGRALLSTSGPLKVLSRHSLSQKSSIYIVSALDRFLVVGETAQGLTCLSEFTNTEENERLRERWGFDFGAPGETSRLYKAKESPFGPTLNSQVADLEREIISLRGESQ